MGGGRGGVCECGGVWHTLLFKSVKQIMSLNKFLKILEVYTADELYLEKNSRGLLPPLPNRILLQCKIFSKSAEAVGPLIRLPSPDNPI